MRISVTEDGLPFSGLYMPDLIKGTIGNPEKAKYPKK